MIHAAAQLFVCVQAGTVPCWQGLHSLHMADAMAPYSLHRQDRTGAVQTSLRPSKNYEGWLPGTSTWLNTSAEDLSSQPIEENQAGEATWWAVLSCSPSSMTTAPSNTVTRPACSSHSKLNRLLSSAAHT